MTSVADCELSAFLRVIELISSVDSEDCWTDAANSEELCASDWPAEATCAAALFTVRPLFHLCSNMPEQPG